jgi:cell division protein FtsZ
MNSPQPNSFPASSEKKMVIKVIGLGDAGCNILLQLSTLTSLTGVELIGLDTDARTVSQFPNGLVLGHKLTRGLGTGGDPEVGRAAAMAQPAELSVLCNGADLVFIIGGLGGGFATGAMSFVARAAKEAGALVLAVVTLPFDFEGVRRHRQAQQGLQHLKPAADGVICLPNQGLAQLFNEDASIVDVFRQSNGLIAQNILAVWRLATQPGLIKVDFAALAAATRGRHSESTSATIEAEGQNRSEEIAQTLFSHPFLRDERLLKESETILVSFAAGADLGMKEVNTVMEQVNSTCPDAHIVFGVAIDEELNSKMSVTVIISRRNKGFDVPPMDEDQSNRFSDAEEPSPSHEEHRSRFSAPSPALSEERKEKFLKQKGRPRQRKKILMQQGQLPLEIISRGRFEKSEPTIHHGEDLDVPTYLRKNIALN